MTPDEARAVASLAGRALAGLAGGTAATAAALGQRIGGPPGPDTAVARRLPAAIAGVVSTGARAVATCVPIVAAAAGAVTAGVTRGDGPPVRDGRAAGPVAVLGATVGHHPAVRDSALGIPMSVRVGGRDVAADPAALAEAFPDAGPQIAVWVHGLGETERCWTRGRGDDRPVPFPQRLLADLGATPVLVRYNTGRRIEDHAELLADLLARTVAGWPVPVTDIVLIGHSMGGLVAHGALRAGRAQGHAWPRSVRLVTSLGSPHAGAPLARVARPTARALAALPETAALSSAVAGLSDGIHDLAAGGGRDQEPTAQHLLVAGTVGSAPDGVLGATVGDLLVPRSSAHDRGGAPVTATRVTVPGTHHQGLLTSDVGYAHLRRSAAMALRPR